MPGVSELLEVWERGAGASAGERALLLLELARPDAARAALAEWSVGERDAALTALRACTFGPHVSCVTACSCGEPLELEFALDDIAVKPSAAARPLTVEHEGATIGFRLPTAGDLAALGRGAGGREPRRWLIERCITGVRTVEGGERNVNELGAEALAAVDAAMATADPPADIELLLSCPACGSTRSTVFDIAGFLWEEIEQRAPRALREVATLAAAFGWSEDQIFALSPWRRARYLEIVTA